MVIYTFIENKKLFAVFTLKYELGIELVHPAV